MDIFFAQLGVHARPSMSLSVIAFVKWQTFGLFDNPTTLFVSSIDVTLHMFNTSFAVKPKAG